MLAEKEGLVGIEVKNLILKIISSFFLFFFFYFLIINNGVLFSICIHFLITMSLWEFLRLSNFLSDKNIDTNSGFYLTRQRINSFDYLLIIFLNILCFFLMHKLFYLFLFFGFFCFFFLYLQKIYIRKLVGTLYISSTIFFLILINFDPNYQKYILFIIFYTIATDISSFFTGKLIGGPKLATKISPGKTISGSIGGLLIPTILIFIFTNNETPFFLVFLTSIFFSFIVQSGDLIESYFKRICFVKESSNLIPGHGGVLDRFDGFFLLIFVVYILKFFNFNFFFIM